MPFSALCAVAIPCTNDPYRTTYSATCMMWRTDPNRGYGAKDCTAWCDTSRRALLSLQPRRRCADNLHNLSNRCVPSFILHPQTQDLPKPLASSCKTHFVKPGASWASLPRLACRSRVHPMDVLSQAWHAAAAPPVQYRGNARHEDTFCRPCSFQYLVVVGLMGPLSPVERFRKVASGA
jgi:hypothetical protein